MQLYRGNRYPSRVKECAIVKELTENAGRDRPMRRRQYTKDGGRV